MKLLRIILFTLFLTPCLSLAQENQQGRLIIDDEVQNIDSLKNTFSEFIQVDTIEDKPNIAALYSAVLPGLGQVYNNKPWKLPIVYSGFVFFGYLLKNNHETYREALEALNAVDDMDERTNPVPPYNRANRDQLNRVTEYYHRNRDLVIILSAAWYLLNIVDAHVDAHLNEFTISDDLTLNVNPSINRFYSFNNYGVSITLNF